jgi:hypothetical protein
MADPQNGNFSGIVINGIDYAIVANADTPLVSFSGYFHTARQPGIIYQSINCPL